MTSPPTPGTDPAARPAWLEPLVTGVRAARPADLTRYLEPTPDARPAAVLMLFGEGPDGPDVLLIQRSSDLSNHAGQPAFPGGATDPEDASPTDTALREAGEEVGLDPAGVEVLATMPPIFLPPSRFVVTPVLAWWREVSPVTAMDPAETASVVRVAVRDLADPANRVLYRYPRSGFVGPAFRVSGLFVWGFTAGLLDTLLRLGGWELSWRPEETTVGAEGSAQRDPEEWVLTEGARGAAREPARRAGDNTVGADEGGHHR